MTPSFPCNLEKTKIVTNFGKCFKNPTKIMILSCQINLYNGIITKVRKLRYIVDTQKKSVCMHI